MTETYSEILSRQWDDLPQPQLLPPGSYLLKARNVHFVPADEENDKPARVTFFYSVIEPMDDVKQADLDNLGADYDFGNNDVAKQFTIFRDKDWSDVRAHVELHGIETAGHNQQETFKAVRGSKVTAYIGTKTYESKRLGKLVTENDPQSFAKFEG